MQNVRSIHLHITTMPVSFTVLNLSVFKVLSVQDVCI
uniref:Uncharacterized protein n=1 Tax=Anguilla anguilla TaxID=7936 RepID=A0A0E9TZ28_ANGAN